ncbi:metal-dependent transcriptional regulator [Nanchangia anserum]|uniref:Metal-dependent transcriptional regulator n=1 Tax=Nanchangia anserum TaxID=2692125 RepID=A0A8I0KWF4_9ACTO|nr:metal-dependent transcriptional regulator [Nanchangia anserum]MBD3689949.1 metal-dependent transcriptional regulator [Nanchangia anserum]QOX82240.1 metal-dependent transcriptional regulator [Nanchangia anserum]
MSDLIDTTEMYLKTVLEMEEDGVTPLRARIVERLGHSGPTVSQTVARMERDGLVHVGRDRRIELSDAGRDHAVTVLRKHRLAERLLLDVIGLEWPLVHDEACRWEHVMSDAVEARLEALLADTDVDPYGNPVPGSGRCVDPLESSIAEACDLHGEIAAATVSRIGEPVQADVELLREIERLEVGMGARVRLRPEGEDVHLCGSSGSVRIRGPLALHYFVVCDA